MARRATRRESIILIPTVEDGLESYLRSALPLSNEIGDVSFEPPSSTWAAQVNRITVSLFLYQVSRSPQPPRPSAPRTAADGSLERRAPLPMVQLSYLVSAWAGSTRDEHQLLGDVLTRLLAQQILPPEHLATPLSSNVQLTLADDTVNRPRDVWGGLGGTLKASFTLLATVAADAYPWETAPRGVTSVDGSLNQLSRPPMPARTRPTIGPADRAGADLPVRRDADGTLHATVPDDRS
ncbi:DUF4255 domain-containing protein [Cellulomonas sp. P24]|uniref:DUF4255 domain-containing protein n=1 Tax=Cellulomonas sp. P24 TaxID=2885206 RepID=UPI00216B16EC|nr:DUF4255 domain-containing protein [Cellulomonas sp. P24]MCR6493041.1 DUF4255 domain-containing protein [Cellulomonas sp. P24]